jgi:hypothetical protein
VKSAARAGALLLAFLFALVALPATAGAHGLVGRTDLAIPAWLFGWAAAIVLVASFAVLGLLWSRPRLQAVDERPLFRLPAWVDRVTGSIGVGLFAVVVYSGLAGTQQATANLAPTFIFVLFWVGVAVLSALLGDVFRAFNPWRAVGRAAGAISQRAFGRRLVARRGYPEWLGMWPAAIGILGFAWIELAFTQRGDPSTIVALALAYAGVQLAGMVAFGVETWSSRGDPFGVYFNLFSRLAPFEHRDGVVHLRPPLSGAPALPILAGTVALLCVAIGSTTFDGATNGPVWSSISPDIQSVFRDLGAGKVVAVQWAATVGLLACVVGIAGFYWLGVLGMKTVGRGHSARELAGRFAHSLIPIALAYAVAHYFSLLIFQGQAAAPLASDPLGRGSNLFGTADVRIDYSVISSNGIWYVQVGALILGHIAGLTLAHDRAISLYTRVKDATRSQYWMLIVMVGFTSLGLWLLSSVNT